MTETGYERDYERDIVLSGERYSLLLTTRAIIEIAKRYGGIENISDGISGDDAAKSLAEIVWLVCLLANQSIMIENRKHPENQKELLNEEDIELLTVPSEIMDYGAAVKAAITAGMKRNVPNGTAETSEKNAENA